MSKTNKPKSMPKKALVLVDCTDCQHACLVQYDKPNDPLLAECLCQPQPYSSTHPYAVEVARAKKHCAHHVHTDEEKWIEHRIVVRRPSRACYVKSQAV